MLSHILEMFREAFKMEKKSVKLFTLWVLIPPTPTPNSLIIHIIIKFFLCISGRIRPF